MSTLDRVDPEIALILRVCRLNCMDTQGRFMVLLAGLNVGRFATLCCQHNSILGKAWHG